jgi:hypothetical protein
MSETAFAATCNELITAIDREMKPRPSLTGFILLYTSIDILAALIRPLDQPDTTGEIFKTWVRDFMLKNSSLPCNEEDLWAARCGLLHTFTIQSRNSRQGKAREIHYISDPGFCKYCQDTLDPKKLQKVFVVPNELVQTFFSGVAQFIESIQTTPGLKSNVLSQAAKLIIHVKDYDPKTAGVP